MTQETSLHEKNNSAKSLLIALAVLVATMVFALRAPERFWNILLVLLGFGTVIFVHELGHYVAAKSVGILVEGFSLGFGPLVVGFKRVQGGYRVRILPAIIPGRQEKGALGFVIPSASAKEGETEYCIRLIPLGGFVKMLGQEDVAADKPSDDPRSFLNRPVWQRAITVSAGVMMNILAAGIIFMIVFARGVELTPAVVGDVMTGSPADLAGVRVGDEIKAINCEENIGFLNLMIAAAFTDEGEKVTLDVRHPDGVAETMHIEPEMSDVTGMRMLGLGPPLTLTIAQLREPNTIAKLAEIGFQPADKIVAVNGQEISHYYQLHEAFFPAAPLARRDSITVSVERGQDSTCPVRHDIEIATIFAPRGPEDLQSQILGMIPRLKVSGFSSDDPDAPARRAGVHKGDIIVRFGSLNNPTLKEIQNYCKEHASQPVELVVLRTEQDEFVEKDLTVTPEVPSGGWFQLLLGKKADPVIGVALTSDLDNPIVAFCKALDDDSEPLALPRGAAITAIAGKPVHNWQDIAEQLLPHKGRHVEITYQMPQSDLTQALTADVPDNYQWLGFASALDLGGWINLPLKPMMKIFKGKNWRDNLRLGAEMTKTFIAQTYLMLRGMIKGTVGVKAVSGPVGILKISYTVAQERSLTYYCYFIAMINVCIAVFNFLPLPILDGGLMVFLIIEKAKGSPISPRIQEIATYVGLVIIGGFVLFVTFQDILKITAGQL